METNEQFLLSTELVGLIHKISLSYDRQVVTQHIREAITMATPVLPSEGEDPGVDNYKIENKKRLLAILEADLQFIQKDICTDVSTVRFQAISTIALLNLIFLPGEDRRAMMNAVVKAPA